MAVKRYLDYEGLQTFWDLIKEYIKKKTEITIETKPLYYKIDKYGDIVYDYEKAEGLAQIGVVYYERSGSGTEVDPYVYTETLDEIIPGETDVSSYYIQGDPQTTVNPTDEERNHPVLDPDTGEQVTKEVVEVDPETEKMILEVIKNSSVPTSVIPNEDILDLWS